MFSSKECVGHAVGGAVIGVAVGMLMQKILSPRSAPQPPNSSDKTRLVCCENVKKRSRSSDLRVPSTIHKKSSRRHPCRSKSASGSKRVEKECSDLSVPRNSRHKSKLSASETKLRSISTEKSEESNKFALKTDGKNVEYLLKESTDYPPFESKVPKKSSDIIDINFNRNSDRESYANASTEYMPLEMKKTSKNDEPAILILDIDNRKSDSINCEATGEISSENALVKSKLSKKKTDEIQGIFNSDSNSNIFATTFTEYLPLEMKKKSANAVPAIFVGEINNRNSDFINSEIIDCSINATCGTELQSLNTESYRKSTETLSPECLLSLIDNNLENDMSNCNINATCNKIDKIFDFDSRREDRSAVNTEELLKKIDSQEFVTLPTFVDSDRLTSTEFDENESK